MTLARFAERTPPGEEEAGNMDEQVRKAVTETMAARENPGASPGAVTTVKLHDVTDYTVRIAEKSVDPLDPPRFRHRKPIALQQDAPAPILTAPTEKLTAEEEDAWRVPACVSNWKNPAGYVIPMDKRVGVDARRFEQPQLSAKFAVMAHALDAAAASITESIAQKNALERQLAMRKWAEDEERMREEARRLNIEKKQLGKRKGRDERILDRLLDEGRSERARQGKRTRDTTQDTGPAPDDQFDARLFADIGSVYTGDDKYEVYDKPLYAKETAYVPFATHGTAVQRSRYAAQPGDARKDTTVITFQHGEQQTPSARAGVFFPE